MLTLFGRQLEERITGASAAANNFIKQNSEQRRNSNDLYDILTEMHLCGSTFFRLSSVASE